MWWGAGGGGGSLIRYSNNNNSNTVGVKTDSSENMTLHTEWGGGGGGGTGSSSCTNTCGSRGPASPTGVNPGILIYIYTAVSVGSNLHAIKL